MLWREVLAFHLAGWSCAWPTLATVAPTDVVRVAVVADPQLTDATSYPSFAPASSWTLAIVERVSDAFQHRAFRRALLPRRPDRVLFLGDLTDGGYATADPREFERVRDRFDRVFRWPRRTEDDAVDENANDSRNRRAAHAPGYLAVHGNHDVGYAYHLARFPRVAARHEASFGPPAFVAAIGGVDVVAVDAMALDGDERRDERTKRAWAFADALKREQREEDDVDETSTTPADETSTPADETSSAAASSERRRRPRVLVSHLPLATSDEGRGPGAAACGALRGSPVVPQRVRRGPGGAVAYQNYLSAASSARLLEAVDPGLVLSGHDHDQCVETHEYRAPPSRGGGGAEAAEAGGRVRGSGGGKTKTVEERTIGAFGWLMGNPRPSFAMLTLRGEGAGDTISEGEATEAAGRDAADGGAAARGEVGVGVASDASSETVAGGVAATRVCFLPEHLRTVRAYAALGAVTALALLVRPSLVVTAAFITAGGAGSDAFAARVFGGEGEDGGGGGRGGGATESSSPARKRIVALTLARAAWRHCGPFFVVAAVVVGLLAGLTLADLATS